LCLKFLILAPKKPNSAKRKSVRVGLSGEIIINAYIPGEGHVLQLFNHVLVQGGRRPDLPGMKYKLVRGAKDLHGIMARRKARSKYGTRFWYEQRKKK